MKNLKLLLLSTLLSIGGLSASGKGDIINLKGEWRYKLDREEVGVAQKWYNSDFDQTLKLPGSLNTNGIGDKVTKDTKWTGSIWNYVWYESDAYAAYREADNTKIAFWLTPDFYYVGVAWYQKSFTVTDDMVGKSLTLNLERPHWQTSVWIDGQNLGSLNSLAVPHKYRLPALSEGEHKLTILVDNSINDINPGVDSHSISDNTQSNWNGMVGEIAIEVDEPSHLKEIKIVPNFETKAIAASLTIEAVDAQSAEVELQVVPKGRKSKSLKSKVYDVELKAGENIVELSYDMSADFALWDEFNPNLYELKVALNTAHESSERTEQFGLRKLTVEERQIVVNGRPTFLRGTLECAIFPKTGFPPTDDKSWERIMKICQEHGLNHIRFHSWCPPRAAFNAADKLGLYLYIECSSWCPDLGNGKPIDQYIYEESERIVKEYGNHPSFCLFSYGNEPHGKNHVNYLREFVTYWKSKESRFLINTASGWASIDENDWHCLPIRIQGWAQSLKSEINAKAPSSVYDWSARNNKTTPIVSHEIGQWCVYPNLDERKKYDGVLKANNFDIFEDRLEDSGLLHLAHDFLMASGRLQVLCYKADIEALLRTENFGGFQLLDLHDFPGQGSALVGVLDPFWDSKEYVTAKEYSEFCNDVVPLARMKRFIFASGEAVEADVEVAQFAAEDMTNASVEWKINNAKGKTLYKGALPQQTIKTGALSKVGSISQVINVDKAEQMQLVIEVVDYKNRWNIWVYPNDKAQKRDVIVSSVWDEATKKRLEEGETLLLSPKFGTMKNEKADSVAVGFSSVFWNTMWTNGQAPHTFGILCDPAHPALSQFPTSYYSDYQWWYALSRCNAIPMHKLEADVEPVVRIIDDWFTARSLGMIVEMKVGRGKLIICSADILTDSEKSLEAQQMQKSLLDYMNSDDFEPAVLVEAKSIDSLFY
ncbi:MAG: beta-galactosidase [Rikenellaceae bacterium]